MYEIRKAASREMARCDVAVAAASMLGDDPFAGMEPPDLVLGHILYWHGEGAKYRATIQIYEDYCSVAAYDEKGDVAYTAGIDVAGAISAVRLHLERLSRAETKPRCAACGGEQHADA